MNEIFDFIKGFDLHNIISLCAVMWYMTKNLREEIKEIKKEIHDVREEIRDLELRLCRIEGAIISKDCCMLKDHSIEKCKGL